MEPAMAEHPPSEALRRDLEWKRTYLRELEKRGRRQQAAVEATEEELTVRRTEIGELEKRLTALQAGKD